MDVHKVMLGFLCETLGPGDLVATTTKWKDANLATKAQRHEGTQSDSGIYRVIVSRIAEFPTNCDTDYCSLITVYLYELSRRKNRCLNHRSNSELKTIKADWPGTPVDSNNRFANLEFPFVPKLGDVFKWKMSRNPQRKEKKEDSFRLKRVTDASFLTNHQDCIVWLGHATFFIRLSGVNMLIDPVFFDLPFLKRYSAHAFEPTAFKKLDYLLISHDHQDHCQEKSIRQIVGQNPDMKILTGLNMETLLRPWCKNLSIEMAGWYQQYKTTPNVEICFLPSRHWSKRGLSDENKRLWGAFIIRSKERCVYFSGDTGYGNHFKEVKNLFPNIDVAIIGIGAYKPEWFMHPNHVSPQEAVKGFHEVGAKIFIPMHYGTFDLSDEPVGEPLRIVEALERENKIHGKVKALSLGENFQEF